MRYILEKTHTVVNGPLKAILETAQKEKNCKESFHLLRENLQNHEQNIGRNMDGKRHSDKVLDRREECAIGNWRKSKPHYKVVKNLAKLYLCSSVL